MRNSSRSNSSGGRHTQAAYEESCVVSAVKLILDSTKYGQWKGTAAEFIDTNTELSGNPIALSEQDVGQRIKTAPDSVFHEAGIGRYISGSRKTGYIYHFFFLNRQENRTDTAADTGLPTFRDKLTHAADRITSPFRTLGDHRPYLIRHMEAAVAHRRFDVCIVQYLSSDVLIPMAECRYVIELPVGGSIDVAADQVLAMLAGLGFTDIEQTLSTRKGYNMLIFKLTW